MATVFSAADELGRYRRLERNKCSSVRASRVVGSACACQEQMKQGKVYIFETLTASNLDQMFFIFFPSVLTTNPRNDEAVMLGNVMPLTGQFLPEVSGLHIRAQPSAELCPPSRKQKLPIHGNYPNDANSTCAGRDDQENDPIDLGK